MEIVLVDSHSRSSDATVYKKERLWSFVQQIHAIALIERIIAEFRGCPPRDFVLFGNSRQARKFNSTLGEEPTVIYEDTCQAFLNQSASKGTHSREAFAALLADVRCTVKSSQIDKRGKARRLLMQKRKRVRDNLRAPGAFNLIGCRRTSREGGAASRYSIAFPLSCGSRLSQTQTTNAATPALALLRWAAMSTRAKIRRSRRFLHII